MENAPTTLLFFTTSFRMVQFYLNRSRYVNLVKEADDFVDEMLESNDEIILKVLKNSSRYMKKLTILFWTSALFTGNMMCISSAILAMFSKSDNLILHSWFPYSFDVTHYWKSYGFQYYIMNVGMLIVPSYHTFIVSIMVIVIAKLKILNHRLSKLKLCNDENSDPRDEFVKCVEDRMKIHSFIRELESLIKSSLFLDFVVFSVLICALLFQASQVSEMKFCYL